METVKSSFLRELGPKTYDTISSLKGYAFIYAAVLLVCLILSFFVVSSIVNFFIELMMGTTIFFGAFLAVIIITFDKEVIYQRHDKFQKLKKVDPEAYKRSKVWGLSLCVVGIFILFLSSQYQKHYSFLCGGYYYDRATGEYHIVECDRVHYHKRRMEVLTGEEISKIRNASLCDECQHIGEISESGLRGHFFDR